MEKHSESNHFATFFFFQSIFIIVEESSAMLEYATLTPGGNSPTKPNDGSDLCVCGEKGTSTISQRLSIWADKVKITAFVCNCLCRVSIQHASSDREANYVPGNCPCRPLRRPVHHSFSVAPFSMISMISPVAKLRSPAACAS